MSNDRPALPQSQTVDHVGNLICTSASSDTCGLTVKQVAVLAALQGLLAGDPTLAPATTADLAEQHADALLQLDSFNVEW